MKFPRLALSALALFTASCLSPKSEEALLFDSLEKLPSLSVNDASSFSLGNENILLSGKQQELTLETIHLFTGFIAAIKTETETICLDNPDSFTKYPFAGKQHFQLENQGLEVSQLQFISKDKEGITLLYSLKNVDNSAKSILFQFQPSTDLKSSILMDSTFGTNSQDQISFDQLTGIFTAKDEANDWYAVWGTSTEFILSPSNTACASEVPELGASSGFEISLELSSNEEKVIPVFIAGSDQGEFTAIETLADLRSSIYSDWDKSFALIDSLRSTSKITIPEQEILVAYEWSKYKFGLFEVGKDSVHGKEIGAGWEYHMVSEFKNYDVGKLDQEIFQSQNDLIKIDNQSVQSLLLELLGIEADIENRVTFIRPNLPKEWNEASIENLWVDDNMLTIEITTDENQMTVEITQTQKKAGLSIELPEKYTQVKVLGKEVNTDTKDGFRRILMTGDHVKIEASL
ncbi:hypothetical protein SAMN04489724_3800 [Algoriphagus locisalis]|uniref:Lipoprotein n=1 Tax=Algoriphagus locisalis TaxID=305507 RepID=A0A1I7D9K5_9BACT|nr:hypothetical protein [Algoriphagus locisalis]SFU08341.1 hypothetical protein SAMN04489724_3800 [Algoriphagus locisalis]